MERRRGTKLLAAVTAIAWLVGCAGARNVTPAPYAASAAVASSQGFLYVANWSGNSIGVYATGSANPVRSIRRGVRAPNAIVFDRAGYLYVSNEGCCVSVYAPGTDRPAYVIRTGVNWPAALAVDRSGNLYVADLRVYRAPAVTVYAPHQSKPARTILDGVSWPIALATDSLGNLYVANGGAEYGPRHGSVAVYAPGATTPTRVIQRGVYMRGTTAGMVIDSQENLYVLVYCGPLCGTGNAGSVEVYAAGRTTPLRSITLDIQQPPSLMLDRSDNLYVGSGISNAKGSITEYARDSAKLIRKIDTVGPAGNLAMDEAGRIYDAASNTIFVYGQKSATPLYWISKGISSPTSIAIDKH